MSKVAKGSFEVTFSRFSGNFIADGFGVQIHGLFEQNIPDFIVPNAHVTYSDLSDFEGLYQISYEGVPSFVGIETINIGLEKRGGKFLKLTGTMQTPIPYREVVTGSAQWTRS